MCIYIYIYVCVCVLGKSDCPAMLGSGAHTHLVSSRHELLANSVDVTFDAADIRVEEVRDHSDMRDASEREGANS